MPKQLHRQGILSLILLRWCEGLDGISGRLLDGHFLDGGKRGNLYRKHDVFDRGGMLGGELSGILLALYVSCMQLFPSSEIVKEGENCFYLFSCEDTFFRIERSEELVEPNSDKPSIRSGDTRNISHYPELA